MHSTDSIRSPDCGGLGLLQSHRPTGSPCRVKVATKVPIATRDTEAEPAMAAMAGMYPQSPSTSDVGNAACTACTALPTMTTSHGQRGGLHTTKPTMANVTVIAHRMAVLIAKLVALSHAGTPSQASQFDAKVATASTRVAISRTYMPHQQFRPELPINVPERTAHVRRLTGLPRRLDSVEWIGLPRLRCSRRPGHRLPASATPLRAAGHAGRSGARCVRTTIHLLSRWNWEAVTFRQTPSIGARARTTVAA